MARPTSRPTAALPGISRVVGVLLLGVSVRLAGFSLPSPRVLSILEDRAELVSPSTSIRRLREAVHLLSASASTPEPWSSPHVHHPPLVVRALAPLVRTTQLPVRLNWGQWTLDARLPSALQWTFILADVLTTLALVGIERLRAPTRFTTEPRGLQQLESALADQAAQARRKSGRVSDTHAKLSSLPTPAAGRGFRWGLVATLYLLNPITILTCLAQSSAVLYAPALVGMLYLASVAAQSQGLSRGLQQLGAAVLLAFNTILSLYPLLLLPPLAILVTSTRFGATTFALTTLLSTAALGALNVLLTHSSTTITIAPSDTAQVWRACYAHLALLTDLAPNVGLWWYFFTEMFDHFRSFFLLTFNAHLGLYVTPLTIKFGSDPFFALTLLVGILAVFQPYPTLSHSALFWSLLSLHPEIFPCTCSIQDWLFRSFVLPINSHWQRLVFLPAFYELWTVTGSGNANFFFASTLVFALAGTSGLLDALWAKGQVVYETERALLLPPAPLSQEEGEDSALPGGEKHVVGTGWIRTTVQV